MSAPPREPAGALLAWGRLLRLSLTPSALADIAAGVVLGAGAWPGGARPFLLMAASACVYHGGMALNDWADRAEDARGGRPRPIPSGAIRPPAALVLALALLLAGPLVAWAVAPRCGLVLGLVAACAALYDLAGRGPLRGPLLLAACRAGNLGAGLALASTLVPFRVLLLLAPLAYGLYVFLVSRLARLEDADPAAGALRPAPSLLAMILALLALGGVAAFLAAHLSGAEAAGVPTWTLGLLPITLALAGARGLGRSLASLGFAPWQAADVQRVAGMGLRRLLVASAALALGAGTPAGVVVAALILCGYPLSFALRRVFPPT
ncbi:MAG TPA: UbiA family prenyltransferase [Planctomycetota bacterium]